MESRTSMGENLLKRVKLSMLLGEDEECKEDGPIVLILGANQEEGQDMQWKEVLDDLLTKIK